MLLEGSFNVMTVITKLLILYNGFEGNIVMNFCYVGFFFLQVVGFLHHQVAEKQWVGATMSITMAISICIQRWEMREFGKSNYFANVWCTPEALSQVPEQNQSLYLQLCSGSLDGKYLMCKKK